MQPLEEGRIRTWPRPQQLSLLCLTNCAIEVEEGGAISDRKRIRMDFFIIIRMDIIVLSVFLLSFSELLVFFVSSVYVPSLTVT